MFSKFQTSDDCYHQSINPASTVLETPQISGLGLKMSLLSHMGGSFNLVFTTGVSVLGYQVPISNKGD